MAAEREAATPKGIGTRLVAWATARCGSERRDDCSPLAQAIFANHQSPNDLLVVINALVTECETKYDPDRSQKYPEFEVLSGGPACGDYWVRPVDIAILLNLDIRVVELLMMHTQADATNASYSYEDEPPVHGPDRPRRPSGTIARFDFTLAVCGHGAGYARDVIDAWREVVTGQDVLEPNAFVFDSAIVPHRYGYRVTMSTTIFHPDTDPEIAQLLLNPLFIRHTEANIVDAWLQSDTPRARNHAKRLLLRSHLADESPFQNSTRLAEHVWLAIASREQMQLANVLDIPGIDYYIPVDPVQRAVARYSMGDDSARLTTADMDGAARRFGALMYAEQRQGSMAIRDFIAACPAGLEDPVEVIRRNHGRAYVSGALMFAKHMGSFRGALDAAAWTSYAVNALKIGPSRDDVIGALQEPEIRDMDQRITDPFRKYAAGTLPALHPARQTARVLVDWREGADFITRFPVDVTKLVADYVGHNPR